MTLRAATGIIRAAALTEAAGFHGRHCRDSVAEHKTRKIRILVAKPGLDGHDRGAKVVAAALRDAGMEVIYTGLHQTPEMIADAAIEEDVDVIALSSLSGAHMTLFPRVLERLRENGLGDRLVIGGGVVPREDVQALETLGFGRIFGPGTSTGEIADYIRHWMDERRAEPEPEPGPGATGDPNRAGCSRERKSESEE